jgi:lipopolysaccharide transport system permease protein
MSGSAPTTAPALTGAADHEHADAIHPRRRAVRRQPRSGWGLADLGELWLYREMLVFQTIRELKVRYRQTALGVAWAVLQPVLTMIVFTIFFGKLAGLPSDGVPYPVFALAAAIPWQLFAYGLTQASNSLVDNAQALTKVYFPRLILPMASIAVALVDFVIAFLILGGLMGYYGIRPDWEILTLPLFVALAVAAALAVGLWLSALNVKYRDVRYAIPFITQIWLFVTPVAYSSSLVPERWRWVYGLNPMAGVVDGFRWALLDTAAPDVTVAASSGVTLLLLVAGLLFFRRLEREFADVI